MQTTLKQNRDVIEEQKVTLKMIEQKVKEKDEADAKNKAENIKLSQ